SSLIECPQPEREMRRGRSIERGVDDRNSPPPDVPGQPRIHRGVGDVAKCVIEEMREDVREHDEPTSKAYLAYANAAQPLRNTRRGPKATGAHVNNGRCLYGHDQVFVGRSGVLAQINGGAPPPKRGPIERTIRRVSPPPNATGSHRSILRRSTI